MKISNYDENNYDYSTYWNNRNYEHLSEVIALYKMLKDEHGDWYLDIGGSFGRHLPLYNKKFAHPVITDFSLNTLINNKFRILEQYPNAILVASNAYYLPFRDNVFNGSMMVRVLHHLEQPDLAFSEVTRVLNGGASHIQEIANKIHAKARVRNIIKGNFKFFDQSPYQQPTQHNFEGTNGTETVFLNFHPDDIKARFEKLGYTLQSKKAVSMLRMGFVKKIVPPKVLLFLERAFQRVLGWTYLAPSEFFKLKLNKEVSAKTYTKIEQILVCPKCKSELSFRNEECICTSCKSKFEKVAGIWDFRVQE